MVAASGWTMTQESEARKLGLEPSTRAQATRKTIETAGLRAEPAHAQLTLRRIGLVRDGMTGQLADHEHRLANGQCIFALEPAQAESADAKSRIPAQKYVVFVGESEARERIAVIAPTPRTDNIAIRAGDSATATSDALLIGFVRADRGAVDHGDEAIASVLEWLDEHAGVALLDVQEAGNGTDEKTPDKHLRS